MTNLEKLRETFPKTIFIFQKNGNDETTEIMCSNEWLQGDYNQMYKDSEPCEVCVSREAMLKGLARIAKANARSDAQKSLMGRVMFFTDHLPPVTPKPRAGHWVEIGDEPYDTWECDNCGFVIDGSGCVDPEEYRDIYKYCPNCGAKMEGVSE